MRNKVNVTPDYLQEMLEPVAWCSVTFPCLASEVTVLLQSCLQAVGALEQSSRTHDHALHDAAVAAFRFYSSSIQSHRKLVFTVTISDFPPVLLEAVVDEGSFTIKGLQSLSSAAVLSLDWGCPNSALLQLHHLTSNSGTFQ
eukprot:Gb_16871 [translate_table: standard]